MDALLSTSQQRAPHLALAAESSTPFAVDMPATRLPVKGAVQTAHSVSSARHMSPHHAAVVKGSAPLVVHTHGVSPSLQQRRHHLHALCTTLVGPAPATRNPRRMV